MMQNCLTLKERENAVSEVIGEIMMLAITVIIFVILIAAIGTIVSKPPTQIVHMDALAINDSTLAIRHTGGDTIDYGHLAVVINGQTGQYPGSDENGDGRWDLGESLYVFGIDTRQSLSIMVYDSITNNVLGSFTLDTLPAGMPATLPIVTPGPTPGPQGTLSGSGTISNAQYSSKGGWDSYTVDIFFTVSNTRSDEAKNVFVTCTPPSDSPNIKNVRLVSSPAQNPQSIPGSSYVQYKWSYSLDVQQNHHSAATFGLSAVGDNTNTISTVAILA